jgi:hypothetical protein
MLEREGPLVAAVVAVAALVAVFPPSDSEPTAPSEPPEATFLAAYERGLTVEAVVDSVFTRTVADGRELSFEQRLVQRPPDDRLVIGAGTATGRIDGRLVRCSAATGELVCTQGGEAPPYEEEVADEVAALASLLSPDTGIYEVDVDDDGCFALDLVTEVLSPPYGTSAEFCFDEATGVQRLVEVIRDEATDRTEAVEIRTEVTDADLRPDDLGEPVVTG